MVLRFLGESVSDSNGLAVLPDGYTGTGAGEIDVVAKTEIDDRIIQSETCSFWDCIYYDDMSTDTNANYYLNTTNSSISYDNANKKLVVTALNSNGMYVDLRGLLNTVKGKTVKFEVDIEVSNCDVRLEFLPKGSATIWSAYTTTNTTLTINSIEVPSDSTNAFFRINTRNVQTGSSFTFKNWKVYSV